MTSTSVGPVAGTTAAELMGRARELAPVFAERAQKSEERRAPLDETIRDLIDSGVLATLTPRCTAGTS